MGGEPTAVGRADSNSVKPCGTTTRWGRDRNS